MLLTINWDSLHAILQSVHGEMLPLAGDLINVARGIGGLGAIFYIAGKVWPQLAKAEPIDLYPLLRPFVIGFCIGMFPVLISVIADILQPVVDKTAEIVQNQNADIKVYREQKDKLERQAVLNSEKAWLESNEKFEAKLKELDIWTDAPEVAGMHVERAMYDLKKEIREWFREVLEVLYQSAALVVDTIRTFFLIVLAIIGPISFGLSIFPGFQSTLTNWIARYINVFMWLPVANIFGAIIAKINSLMLQKEISDMQAGGTFDATDTTYLIFLIIGICGYASVPSVAGYIIHSIGGGVGGAMSAVTGIGSAAGGAVLMGAGKIAGTGGSGGRVSMGDRVNRVRESARESDRSQLKKD